MGMPPHHFFPGGGQEPFETASLPLLGFQRHEQHGVEHVTQFFEHGPSVAAMFDRFKDFPGFLNEIGKEARHGLGAVPGAPAGRLEAAGGGDEVPKGIAAADLRGAC